MISTKKKLSHIHMYCDHTTQNFGYIFIIMAVCSTTDTEQSYAMLL
jgi:hypothetical protein